jgi:hypothetical protein
MPTGKIDVESRIHRLSGFPSLAHFIASDRDRTTLIFKRYDELAARNLLYLQSELAGLQGKQRAFDQEDLMSNLSTKQCARNYLDFKLAVQADDARQKDRWKLMKDIRETLKEYREALLFESTLATLPRPSKGVLRAFQTEFYNQTEGKGEPFPTLGGYSAGLYDDIDDLVALRVHDDQDRLTTFAQEHLAFFFPVSRPPFQAPVLSNVGNSSKSQPQRHRQRLSTKAQALRHHKSMSLSLTKFAGPQASPPWHSLRFGPCH